MKKRNQSADAEEIKKVYRKAKQGDLDKWVEARSLETSSMYRARTIALNLGLEMKLSDVEYQGDKSKAVFYYTAEARVDFRELIKVLAEEFRVRIEMRQIGARQEASRLGGIGSCGRELCCSTWLTDFRTVSTSAARYQQLSLNPLKLAGQCGKLKCCLNYELDAYAEALKEFPDLDGKRLNTRKGEAFLQKTDIFKRMMWFSYKSDPSIMIPMDVKAVKSILEANKNGEQPEELIASKVFVEKTVVAEPSFTNHVVEESLTRFDKKRPQKNKGGQQSQKQKAQHQKNKPKGPRSENPKSSSPDKQANRGQGSQNRPKPRGPNPNKPNQPRNDQKQNPNTKPDK